MKELFWESVKNIYTDDDKKYLIFFTDWEKCYVYRAGGDCCSASWFESIENIENMIKEKIIGIEEKNIEVERDGELKIYGYTFKTKAGYTDIEFRNESNGFYDGSCELVKDFSIEWSDASKHLTERFRCQYDLTVRNELLLKLNDSEPIKINDWQRGRGNGR